MRGIRAEEQGVARLRRNRHGIFGAEAGRRRGSAVAVGAVAAEIDTSPLRAARHEQHRPAVDRHFVDHDQRLHEAATAVDVGPGPVALVAMLNVLMPVEDDTVVRAFEVCLIQQLIHRVAS
jgi:hypothetical protein